MLYNPRLSQLTALLYLFLLIYIEPNPYYLVHGRYDARYDNEFDQHRYQLMMTHREFEAIEEIATEDGTWWFKGSYHEIWKVCEVTQREYERFREHLGGKFSWDIWKEIHERIKSEGFEDNKKRQRYYLVEVLYGTNIEYYDEAHYFQMMMTKKEFEMWDVVWGHFYEDPIDHDAGMEKDFPSMKVIFEVTQEEYDKFSKKLGGLHSEYILSLIRRGLSGELKKGEFEKSDNEEDSDG